MKNIVGIFIILLSFANCLAGTLDDIDKLNVKLTHHELDSYIKKADQKGLSGHYLSSIIPGLTFDATQVCPIDDIKEGERYEVILVAESASTTGSSQSLVIGASNPFSDEAYAEFRQGAKDLTLDDKKLREHVKKFLEKKYEDYKASGYVDPEMLANFQSSVGLDQNLGRSILIESLIHAGALSSLNDKDLANRMSSIIKANYKTEEEKYNFLSALSERLYFNYNSSRNPFANGNKNNPDHKKLPSADLSLKDILKAAADGSEFDSGVCNDYSEALAIIAQEVLPEKDVLVINSETHFALMISDGKKTRVIDSYKQYDLSNHLYLRSDSPAQHLRISRVNDQNQLEQIAVVDTQVGELMEDAFKTGKKLLKTSPDINSLMATFSSLGQGQKGHDIMASAGSAKLIDSNVAVFVAKYTYKTSNVESYAGVGLSAQGIPETNHYSAATRFQVHARLGASGNLIHYVNPNSEFKLQTGLRADGMIAINPMLDQMGDTVPTQAGNIEWFNRLDFVHGKVGPDSFLIRGGAEVVSSLGVNNWGGIVSDLSTPSAGGVLNAMGKMTFHLNQVNANAGVEKRIIPGIKLQTQGDYQGSHVGQSVGIISGIEVKVPEDVQLYVFVGASTSKLPGILTKNSILVGPEGFKAGAGVRHSGGLKAQGQVQGVGSERPMLNFNLEIPLGPSRPKE